MWNTTIIYCLFPNTLLLVQGDHVELARVFPCEGRVDRAVMELALYIPKAPSTDEERIHWDKNMQLVLDVVTGEDFPTGRTIQLGLTSGAQTHTVFGRNEPAMIHYHRSLRAALRLDPVGEVRGAVRLGLARRGPKGRVSDRARTMTDHIVGTISDAAMAAPILEARHVTLRFRGVKALSDVSFAVREGELFSIIGPNGAGKTSIVNCISGRYRPDDGAILYRGAGHHAAQDQCAGVARDRPHVPEPRAVPPHDACSTTSWSGAITCCATTSSPARSTGSPARGARNSTHRRKVEDIIDFLDLQPVRKAVAGTLPYGLRKRVELARAMALEPRADPPRRADGRHEPRGEGGHGALHRRPERGVRDDGGHDRARHGRRHGHLASGSGARFRAQDRRGRAGRGAGAMRRCKRAYLGEDDDDEAEPSRSRAA